MLDEIREMLLKKWEKLPVYMQNHTVQHYYDIINSQRVSLLIKRLFDIFASAVILLLIWPVMLIIAILVRCDTQGSAIFQQDRITRYGRRFKILKFRTMVNDAEKIGTLVTVSQDSRITRIGKILRNSRLDELPQLINIFKGDMSFVGTRPEIPKYVEQYTDEMKATLLLPAGVTSEASILYKDEYRLLSSANDVDEAYVTQVLPQKMKFNIASIANFSIFREAKTLILTVLVVTGLLRISKMNMDSPKDCDVGIITNKD